MKRGYKHNTAVSGDDSEHYAGRLFLMLKNPNHSRRPDLISINGRFDPRLSLELKSGKNYKGVMVATQLHYAVTTADDYVELLGEDLPLREGFLEGEGWDDASALLPGGEVAYYYCLINRADKLKSTDLDRPYASIRLQWGDQFIVPHQFGFYAFAVASSRRSGSPINEVILQMKDRIRRDVLEGCSHHEERQEDMNSWQDLHGRDILAIYHRDHKGELILPPHMRGKSRREIKLLTEEGIERVAKLREVYPLVDDLKRIEIPGPNGTTIYALVESEHEDLFDKQFRQVVEQRTPVIERVTRARERAESLLENITTRSSGSPLFPDMELEEKVALSLNLQPAEMHRLQRLALWLDKGESQILAPRLEIEEQEKEEDPVPF